MRSVFGLTGLALSLSVAPALMAQGSLAADLLKDISEVETKLVGLAKAIPADKYAWRPGEKVRSVSELFMHVAADNYLIPAAAGTPAPPATGVKGDDYKTAVAFEKKQLDRDGTIRELEGSFRFLRDALRAADGNMGKTVKLFGQDHTLQQVWILTATHLHEHLGQAIAYARTNGVVPPWSQ